MGDPRENMTHPKRVLPHRAQLIGPDRSVLKRCREVWRGEGSEGQGLQFALCLQKSALKQIRLLFRV